MEIFTRNRPLRRQFHPSFLTDVLEKHKESWEKRHQFVRNALNAAQKQKDLILELDYTGHLSAELTGSIDCLRKDLEGKMNILDGMLKEAKNQAGLKEGNFNELENVKNLKAECRFYEENIEYFAQFSSNLHTQKSFFQAKIQTLTTKIVTLKTELRRISVNNTRLSELLNDLKRPLKLNKPRKIPDKISHSSVSPTSKHLNSLQIAVTDRRKSIKKMRHLTWVERSKVSPKAKQRNMELKELFSACMGSLPGMSELNSREKKDMRLIPGSLSMSFQEVMRRQPVMTTRMMLVLVGASKVLQGRLLTATLC